MDGQNQPDTESGAPHEIRVFGHKWTREALQRAAAEERLSQAYLLSGPPDIGKARLALRFAQAMLCEASAACGRCRSCRLVAHRGAPDLHWVEPPLRIEAVRDLQRELILAPAEAVRRIAVLPDFELASPGAANALLKTLEEPPAGVVIVLTTSDVERVLPTVVSRCQVFPLRPLSVPEAAASLSEGWGIEAAEADLLARLSGGRLGWAVRAAQDPSVLEEREGWLANLERMLRADTAERIRRAGELARSREGIPTGLSVWLGWWRDLLLVRHGISEPVVNRDRTVELQAAAARYSTYDIVGALGSIQDTLSRLAANTNPQLALEVLVLELPS